MASSRRRYELSADSKLSCYQVADQVIERGSALLLLLLLATSLPFFACLEIEIPPLEGPLADAAYDSGREAAIVNRSTSGNHSMRSEAAGAPINLRFRGEDIDRDDWPKALTISRFFFSSVKNRSGSLPELTRPALVALLAKKGFLLSPDPLMPEMLQQKMREMRGASPQNRESSGSKAYTKGYGRGGERGGAWKNGWRLDIHFMRQQLLWLPPQEFIQSPNPVRWGEVRLDFEIEMRLWRISAAPSSAFKPADSAGSAGSAGSAEPAEASGSGWDLVWLRTFSSKRSLAALPGTEAEVMAIAAHRALEEWLQLIDENLPTG